jgi:hypothetical protein
MYSAAGAAIGEALGRRFGDRYEEQPIDLSEETMRDRATRVRAAALHASVRFCAGMGHVSSSSVIERAFESAGEPPAAGVAAWCDTLCGALVDARGEVARTSGGRL